MATNRELDWNRELLDQLVWHWGAQLRPRLAGLTDNEYFWEPASGPVWTVHRLGAGTHDHGSGDFRMDGCYPPPERVPFTTIAWRIAHLVTGVLGARAAAHFGGPAADDDSFPYAGTAGLALQQLDAAYSRWADGVRSLGTDGLSQPCGVAEGPFADAPMAALVLHIHREVIHHGAEIALLRDLYATDHR